MDSALQDRVEVLALYPATWLLLQRWCPFFAPLGQGRV